MDSPLPEGSTALLWGLYLAILRSSSHAHTRDILSCRVSAIVALKQRQISRGRRGLTQGLVVRLVALCARRHSRGRPRRQPPEGSCVLVEPGEDQPCIRCPFYAAPPRWWAVACNPRLTEALRPPSVHLQGKDGSGLHPDSSGPPRAASPPALLARPPARTHHSTASAPTPASPAPNPPPPR